MIRVLLAVFLPWVMFFTIGRPLSGIACLILQVVFFGSAVFTGGLSLTLAWIPSLWGIYALVRHKAKEAA